MRIDQEKRMDRILDQALRAFPLEPAPEHLKANILGQIEKPLVKAQFRISWIDLALSGALALIIGILADFIQGVVRSPYWTARIQVGLLLIWQDWRYFFLHNQPLILAVLLSAGVVFALLGVLASVYWRYTADLRRLPA